MAAIYTINSIYPWSRSFDEYRRMFALSDADWNLRILSCADGPASFNAEMHRLGQRVISCDPLYQFDASVIRQRVAATAPEMIRNAAENAHRFIWDRIKSPEHMGRLRMAAMEAFLQDYEIGIADGRYLVQQLPELTFSDGQFDLGLCSHFLFLYSRELTVEFHIAAVKEMCRVAREVRIFPLLSMQGDTSPHVMPVMRAVGRIGMSASIESVDYEFQRGGNQMMKIQRASQP